MIKRLSKVKKPAFEAHTQWAAQPPTSILMIRHGETDWNVKRVIQGWKGTDLNALGRRQARIAATRVKAMGLKIDVLLSSDLKRAMQTAAAFKLPIHRVPEWRERNFGVWEGQSIEQILAKYKLGPKARRDPFLAFEPRGGETMKVFAKRMERALSLIEKRYAGKTVAVVTHGGPMRIAACLVSKTPPDKYFFLGRPGNSSLSMIQSQGGVRWLEFYNDTSHLEGKR